MIFGIIGAMDEEIAYIENKMTQLKKHTIANSSFIEGIVANKKVILLKSGIGKVNAAMATTVLIERFKPTLVINTGSAGGFTQSLSVGDLVISDEVIHHDVDATAFNYELGQVPQMPARYKANQQLVEQAISILDELDIRHEVGLIATGDSFMSDPQRVEKTRKQFPEMLAAEMEGAAIAQVCYQYEIPFIIIRALSDIAGKDSSVTFEQFLQIAAENSAKIILSFIEQFN